MEVNKKIWLESEKLGITSELGTMYMSNNEFHSSMHHETNCCPHIYHKQLASEGVEQFILTK